MLSTTLKRSVTILQSRSFFKHSAALQCLGRSSSAQKSLIRFLPTQDTNLRLSLVPHSHFSTSADASVMLNSFDTPPGHWAPQFKGTLRRHLQVFGRNQEAQKLAVGNGVNASEWPKLIRYFQRAITRDPTKLFASAGEQQEFIDMVERSDIESIHPLFDKLIQYAKERQFIIEVDSKSAELMQLIDMRLPHEWNPEARFMRRKIIYHGGPTNSGKTYQALERLKEAGEGGGLYCGPLRLLALEVYDKLNSQGIYCSLITGQEKREVPTATHVSCTIEMIDPNRVWDVAVVDEIQMINDAERGWAWTRALMSLQANEIHICGSTEAAELARNIAKLMDDEFEVYDYDRRSKLTIMDHALGSYKKVVPGDCIVTFSRRKIFEIKDQIERNSKLKCCVIYGSLPPETRSQQARLFNERGNGYDILIASDAIGMGLNLNIRRVILDTVKKFNGQELVDVTPSLIKQIAGRAGRSGSDYPEGFATCLLEADMKYLRESYHAEPVMATSAGLFPTSEMIEEFAYQMPDENHLSELLNKFVLMARLDGSYFMCNHEDMKNVADLLHEIPLNLRERFTFCMAPLNLRNPLSKRIFLDYVRAHSMGEKVQLNIFLPKEAPKSADRLHELEMKGQIIDLYLWLSIRFPNTFVEGEKAEILKTQIVALVQETLLNTSLRSKSDGKHHKSKKNSHHNRDRYQSHDKSRSKTHSSKRRNYS